MTPKRRSGRTFDPYREVVATLGLVAEVGFVVVGGALVGLGLGYGVDLLTGGRTGRIAGLLLGLGSGVWAAGHQLMRVIKKRQGDKDP